MNPSDFLAGLPIFAGMSGLELGAVAAFLEPRRFAEGEVVFHEGDGGTELYIVRSGRIGSYMKEDGDGKRDIYEFAPGALFGEMAVIEGAPRSATCWAKEDSELLVLDAIDFYRLVWEHPVLGVKLLSAMARYMVSWLDEASGFLHSLVRWGETARRRAITDDLTGLFNRRFLEETMNLRFARGSSPSRPCSIAVLDIDRFREVNAAFGQRAGDAVIANAAAAFGRALRETEVAARLSGDEFAVFVPDAGLDRALELAERLRTEAAGLFLEFRSSPSLLPVRTAITISVGTASCPEHATTATELFAAADRALFKAKQAGRNRTESAG